MGTSQLKLEAFRRAVVTQCLAVETKPHYVLSLKWHLSEVRAELKDGFCFVLEGNKLPGPLLLLFVPAVPLVSSLLTLR